MAIAEIDDYHDLPEALRPYEPDRKPTLSVGLHLLGDVTIAFTREADHPERGSLNIVGDRDGSNGRLILTIGEPCFATTGTVIEQLEAVLVGLREMAAEAERA